MPQSDIGRDEGAGGTAVGDGYPFACRRGHVYVNPPPRFEELHVNNQFVDPFHDGKNVATHMSSRLSFKQRVQLSKGIQRLKPEHTTITLFMSWVLFSLSQPFVVPLLPGRSNC